MRDDFRYIRPIRGLIYDLLSLLNRIVIPALGFVVEKIGPSVGLVKSKDRLSDNACDVLIAHRRFGGSNEIRVSQSVENIQRIVNKRVDFCIREGNTFFGNARWLRKQLGKRAYSHLIITDPQLIGFPGPLGILQCLLLAKKCNNRKVNITLFLYDVQDPQGTLFGGILGRVHHNIALVCSTPMEALQYSKITRSVGPILEACFSDTPAVERRKSLSNRPICVHLPRPTYEPRKSVVRHLYQSLETAQISHVVGGSFQTSEELFSSLCLTKITVVTNSLIVGSVGRWPRPDGPTRHLVSYNFEALQAGSLLLAERCEPLDSVLSEGKHFIGFSSAEEAQEKIFYYLKHESAGEKIALAGNERFTEFVRSQRMLSSLMV